MRGDYPANADRRPNRARVARGCRLSAVLLAVAVSELQDGTKGVVLAVPTSIVAWVVLNHLFPPDDFRLPK